MYSLYIKFHKTQHVPFLQLTLPVNVNSTLNMSIRTVQFKGNVLHKTKISCSKRENHVAANFVACLCKFRYSVKALITLLKQTIPLSLEKEGSAWILKLLEQNFSI